MAQMPGASGFPDPIRYCVATPKVPLMGARVVCVARRLSKAWTLGAVLTALAVGGCSAGRNDRWHAGSAQDRSQGRDTSRGALRRMPVDWGAVSHDGVVWSGAAEIYRVPGFAMEPTLPIGTRVVAKPEQPFIGAIVVFHPPVGWDMEKCGPSLRTVKTGAVACAKPNDEEDKFKLVARIVAGPGNQIYIKGGHVYRKVGSANGFVREHDSYTRACGNSRHCDFPIPIRISRGYWFVMGDNRGASNDSRFWGPVPTRWIVGVVTKRLPQHRYGAPGS